MSKNCLYFVNIARWLLNILCWNIFISFLIFNIHPIYNFCQGHVYQCVMYLYCIIVLILSYFINLFQSRQHKEFHYQVVHLKATLGCMVTNCYYTCDTEPELSIHKDLKHPNIRLVNIIILHKCIDFEYGALFLLLGQLSYSGKERSINV
jgi:hypothetical protein